mmetsp:Transcript_76843/g.222053  ORF Transcript_76843/g.222053 Transcript_76843/m.222053 type:complete len:137 (+) Transcript_76843:41-451(+)
MALQCGLGLSPSHARQYGPRARARTRAEILMKRQGCARGPGAAATAAHPTEGAGRGGSKVSFVRVSAMFGELRICKPSTPITMLPVALSISFDRTHISEIPQFFNESASAGPCRVRPRNNVLEIRVSLGTWKYNEQ